MIVEKDNFFVLTGGPGAGKTSVINALISRGIYCVSEAGREIIQAQVAIGGFAVPWDDQKTYRELNLAREMQTFCSNAQRSELVIFDRGLVDVLGYSNLIGLTDTLHIQRAIEAHRYNRQAFIAPPWEAIFTNDAERKQSFQEAVATFDAMVSAYESAGYDLIELPRVSVADRVQFILENTTG